MTREELRNNYEKEICELCHREYYTSRALPESLCEGQFCEEAEDSLAEKIIQSRRIDYDKRKGKSPAANYSGNN